MITRLKISGFKNLVDVDVRFGPFTCIAGLNGVGKSNLFDAIRFLSSTASMTLADAASRVRDEGGRPSEIRDLFSRDALNQHGLMSFEVEMITPVRATDDLGADARATANFLVYRLELKHRQNGINGLRQEGIEIVKEELEHIQKSQATSHLPFAREAREWRNSLLSIAHRTAPFISTATEEGKVIIRMHQDGGSSGRPKTLAAGTPRTVLSIANASESPTALCARREMESWMLLQLEPSSLREPDHVNAPHMLSQEGEHLPATLHALAQRAKKPGMSAKEAKAAEDKVYATISNRLSMLIDNLRSLKVDHDEKRDTLTLCAGDNQGVWYSAKALSDGTLRFLALAVLEHDSSGRNVICLEEPENGIHPQRIPAIINLLQDIATDIHMEVDETNPPRQVIINTHSPEVVRRIPDDSLVLARRAQLLVGSGVRNGLEFRYLDHTWRSECEEDHSQHIHKGELLDYLSNANGMNDVSSEPEARPRRKLVGQREDLQQLKLNLSL